MPTLQSRPNWSDKRRATVRRALLRSWQPGGAHYERFRKGEPDAPTLRKRALWDRKGQLAATLTVKGRTHKITHSKARIDSYEVNGIKGGRAKVGLYLGGLLP